MDNRAFMMERSAIAGVIAVRADTSHTFPRHTHEEFGIGVIDRGAQRSSSGRGMVEAGAGDVITVNPGEVHDGAPIEPGGRAWRMLYAAPAVIAEATRAISEGKCVSFEFCRPAITDTRIAARFRTLFAAATCVPQAKATPRCEELLLDLIPHVMGDDAARNQPAAAPGGIDIAKALIDDDPAAPMTLADLARVSGLSRFQVVRGFRRATGLSAHAYLVQRRIDLARRLIVRRLALAEAAAAAGFADQSHMTRLFVQRFGISPRAYADAVN